MAPLKEIHPLARAAARNVFNGRIARECPQTLAAASTEQLDVVFTLSAGAEKVAPSVVQARAHVRCGDRHGRKAEALAILPAAVIVRVDGGRRPDDRIRSEFRAVKSLRQAIGNTPMMMLVDHVPSPDERRILRDTSTACLPRGSLSTGPVVPAIRAALQQPVSAPVPPTVAVAYFGPQQRCAGMCQQFERAGLRVLCGAEYGRTPEALGVAPDGIVVRVDGQHASPESVRPEFRAVQRIRDAFSDVPILLVADHVPAAPEQQVLQACEARFINRRAVGSFVVSNTVKALVSHRPHS